MQKSLACKVTRRVVQFLGLTIIVAASFLLHNFLSGNLHTVIPGLVYRSAILSKPKLIAVIDQHHIKAILNLAGEHVDASWYRDERQISQQQHIEHRDFSLPAHGKISRLRLRALMQLLQHLPQPLLVHCRAGADRTGLAAAMLIILHGNYVSDDWQDQVSWWYNLLSPSSIGFIMMQDYNSWLLHHQLSDTKAHFIDWVYSKQTIGSHQGWFFT